MIRNVAVFISGRWTRWLVILFWLVLVGGLSPLAGKLTDVQKNDTSAWLPKNAEATKVIERSEKFHPGDTLPTIVVYDRSSGVTPADMSKATADARAFKGIEDVTGQIIGPMQAKDGKAIQTIVTVNLGKGGWAGVAKTVDKMLDTAKAKANGLEVNATGPGGYAADSGKIFGGNDILLLTSVAVVILILLFTYRSPVLWILPLFSAVVSLMVSEGVIYLLAKHAGLTVNAQSQFILTVLVFGAATDYALLLIARYREELRKHDSQYEAMAEALHRSGSAIIASAATVAASMLVLLLAALNSTKGLGPVCAIGIGVSLLVMTTLLPALLVRGKFLWLFFESSHGRWIFWPSMPRSGTEEPTTAGLWARVGKRISPRPRIVWVGTAVVLGVMALGILGLKADGLQQKDGFTKRTQAVVGEEIQAEHFPAGSGQPVVVVAKASATEQVKSGLAALSGISEVATPVTKDGDVYIEGTLKDGAETGAAQKTVKQARTAMHKIDGASAQVGGGTALKIDMDDASRHDVKLIIPVVLLVVFLILALLLRSLVAPLLLIGTVVISFGATLGISALTFNHLFGFAGADTSFPLWAFVFLVALGIDYNIFLVTRVREETEQHGTRRGALIGLGATGGVITSAGLVLAGTFGALGAMPLVFAAEIGFAVAFGVLLDTIVVRSVLVTALTLDVGRWMWWPSKLAQRHDPVEPPAGEEDIAPAFAGK